MQVPPELGIKAMQVHSLFILGVLVAHKTGINPAALAQPFHPYIAYLRTSKFLPSSLPPAPRG